MSHFLQALSDYASQIGLPPPMYRTAPVRYIIHLDSRGFVAGPLTDTLFAEEGRSTSLPVAATGRAGAPRAGSAKLRSMELTVPDLKRSNRIAPKLLSDRADYTLGIVRTGDDPDKAARRHWAYIKTVQACAEATGEPSVWAVFWFLTGHNAALLDLPEAFHSAFEQLPAVGLENHEPLDLPEDFDDGARITFDVNGAMPIDLPTVRAHWADVAAVGEDELLMQCQLCLKQRPPVRRLPVPIQEVPGGQRAGMALISMDKPAFWSYGLEHSLNAPICEECQHRVGTSLNSLLRAANTHWKLEDRVFVFWARERMPLPLGQLLSESDPATVQRLLAAPWDGAEGRILDIDSALFYVAVLKANDARLALLDWYEGKMADLLRNLARYFALQRTQVYHPEKRSVRARTFPLWQLGGATIRVGGKEKVPPAVETALLRLALEGGPLPQDLLTRVLARIEAQSGAIYPAQAACLKLFLLSQEDVSWLGTYHDPALPAGEQAKGGERMTTRMVIDEETLVGLNEGCTDVSYLLGRVFVELEDLQFEAIGDVNNGIRDRYLVQAAAFPALHFTELLKEKEVHLMKLRRHKRASYLYYEMRIGSLLARISDFPQQFGPEEAARFLLATHHQRLANILARMEAKKKRKAEQLGTSPEEVQLSDEEQLAVALPHGAEPAGRVGDTDEER